jgi:hypothetical protein
MDTVIRERFSTLRDGKRDLCAKQMQSYLLQEPRFTGSIKEEVEHVLWMLEQIRSMDDQQKAARWLGFVQGWMWCMKTATIDGLREMTRMLKD